jgi:hypothetical protein
MSTRPCSACERTPELAPASTARRRRRTCCAPDFADAAKVKQYHKEGRPLRTETVINDPGDFGIGKG